MIEGTADEVVLVRASSLPSTEHTAKDAAPNFQRNRQGNARTNSFEYFNAFYIVLNCLEIG